MDRVLNILGSIVTVGLVTVVVTNGGNTATVIRAVGDVFANSLGTAMGRR